MKLIKFYAEWCGPCKVLEKRMEQLNIEHTNIDIESDEGIELTEKYKIKSVPTLVLLDDKDNEIKRVVGAVGETELKELYENNRA